MVRVFVIKNKTDEEIEYLFFNTDVSISEYIRRDINECLFDEIFERDFKYLIYKPIPFIANENIKLISHDEQQCKVEVPDHEILEFYFEEDEEVTFMMIIDKSSEQYEFIKRSNREFFLRMARYMYGTLEISGNEKDKVIVKIEDNDNYVETIYSCHDKNGLYDLTTYHFIEVKWYC